MLSGRKNEKMGLGNRRQSPVTADRKDSSALHPYLVEQLASGYQREALARATARAQKIQAYPHRTLSHRPWRRQARTGALVVVVVVDPVPLPPH
jgi:hypothetical protein